MSLSYTALSELDAVNQILANVGEAPISCLETSGVSVASLALQFLHDASRDVQALGLECNSESEYPLLPNDNKKFELPLNTLRVDPSDKTKAYVYRNGFLYDKQNHTFVIDEDSIKADIVFFLEFEQLPQSARKYIAVKAARQFQARWQSSEVVHKLTEDDERRAWYDLFDEELQTADCNIFNNAESQYILNRY